MAQDIIIRTLCDLCMAAGEEQHDARPYTIGDGPVLLDVDLCDVHAKPLAELVEHARPSERKTARGGAAGMVTCPECGRLFGTPGGMRRHVRQSHGAETAPGVLACGIDGCGRVFASQQAVSMHRFRAHGIRSDSPGARAARERESRRGSA